MPGVMVPLFAVLLPTIGNPAPAGTRRDPTTRDPHMGTAAPLPEARRPDVARPRCGHDLHLRRRGRNGDINSDAAEAITGVTMAPAARHRLKAKCSSRVLHFFLLRYNRYRCNEYMYFRLTFAPLTG